MYSKLIIFYYMNINILLNIGHLLYKNKKEGIFQPSLAQIIQKMK